MRSSALRRRDPVGIVTSPRYDTSWRDLGLAAQLVAVTQPEQPSFRLTQRCGASDDAFQDDREIARIRADQPEHLARCGLEFERLGQFGVALLDLGEQPGIVDGDRRLIGERLQQRHLDVGEPARCHTDEGEGAEHVAAGTAGASADSSLRCRAICDLGNSSGGSSSQSWMCNDSPVAYTAPVVVPSLTPDEFRHPGRHRLRLQLGRDRDDLVLVERSHVDDHRSVLTQALRMVHNAVEHRLEVEAGGTDGVKYVGHGRLAFEGGVEVVEQPCVRDGERRLVGERLEDLEFGVVERTHLRPHDVDVADPLGLAEQRNRGVAPGVRKRLGEFGGDHVEIVECQRGVARGGVRVHVAVVGGELHPDRHVGVRVDLRCGDPENRPILQEDAAEGCVAQVGGLRHDRIEHGRQIARVGADQSQRLARRGLQFQRLGQFAVAFLDLTEEAGVVDGDRRLVGEGL